MQPTWAAKSPCSFFRLLIKMKILVSGGDGFLGTAVVSLLRQTHTEVHSLTRRSERQGVTVYCDLSVASSVSAVLSAVAPECIVNLAATVDFSKNVLPLLYPVNSLCPAIMAEYCRRTGALLVQASSIVVLGYRKTCFVLDSLESPDTDYGRSKLIADHAILASGCMAAIIRFGGIFGENGPQHLGLNRVIAEAKQGARPRIVGTGSALRNYIHVADAATMISRCISEGIAGVLYAGGETRSVLQMYQSVCDVWLPGQMPLLLGGEDGQDQLVLSSEVLGATRSFDHCLRGIP